MYWIFTGKNYIHWDKKNLKKWRLFIDIDAETFLFLFLQENEDKKAEESPEDLELFQAQLWTSTALPDAPGRNLLPGAFGLALFSPSILGS